MAKNEPKSTACPTDEIHLLFRPRGLAGDTINAQTYALTTDNSKFNALIILRIVSKRGLLLERL